MATWNVNKCVVLAVLMGLLVFPALAEEQIPDHWQKYPLQHLELKPGIVLYQVGQSIRVDDGPDWPRPLTAKKTKSTFAAVSTPEQARELCELLIYGAVVENEKAYKALFNLHEKEKYLQLVKDEELSFKQVAEQVDGGFKVAFTAFYEPTGMGAQCNTARFEFFVGEDASVKKKSTPYLIGPALNWQTGLLDTEEARAKEAKAQGRVRDFVATCYKHCSTRLPQHEYKR